MNTGSQSTNGVPNELTDDPIITTENLTVRFDMARGQSRVIDDISVAVERGEILGVVGESGSGKSMFASAMLDAVVNPGITTGQVTYHPEGREPIDILNLDQDMLKQLRWEEISMVFQGAMSSFNPTMAISEHFVETIEAHNVNYEQGVSRAKDLLAELYLDPERVWDSYPHELSGGMKQRALIALSLVLDPAVLVMDEPTAALDLLMQRSILNLIREIQENHNLTVIFITHDLPLAAKLADRIAVMYAFQFVEVAPTDEILYDASHPYTRGLLKSTPNLNIPIEDMQAIEGSSPDPVNAPEGCSYHPRCSLATEECRESDPPFFNVDTDHVAACYHWEKAAEAVSFDVENIGGER